MDFELPKEITDKLAELDAFIEAEIKPLERENMQFFDHRREHARTDWDDDGRPRAEWRALISGNGAPRRQGGAPALRPAEVMRRPGRLQPRDRGDPRTPRRQRAWACTTTCRTNPRSSAISRSSRRSPTTAPRSRRAISRASSPGRSISLSRLTEPGHGSDATWLETTGVRDGDHWVINGRKRWNSQVARAHANLVFARTSGKPGEAKGITAFIVPDRHARPQRPLQSLDLQHAQRSRGDGFDERARARQRDPAQGRRGPRGRAALRAREPHPPGGGERRRRALLHPEGRRIRQDRVAFGEPLAKKQAIQFPLVELWAEYETGAQLHLPHRLADGPAEPAGDQRHGLDLQFPRQPAVLRGGRQGDAGAWRHRLQPRAAVRAHLPPPPPLSHHRRHGGGADAPRRAVSVRLRRQARERG